MYQAIEQWKESGISPQQFCTNNKLTLASFNYWLKAYIKERGQFNDNFNKASDAFIPIEVSSIEGATPIDSGQIEIKYPNGVHISFSESIAIDKLRTLISI